MGVVGVMIGLRVGEIVGDKIDKVLFLMEMSFGVRFIKWRG